MDKSFEHKYVAWDLYEGKWVIYETLVYQIPVPILERQVEARNRYGLTREGLRDLYGIGIFAPLRERKKFLECISTADQEPYDLRLTELDLAIAREEEVGS